MAIKPLNSVAGFSVGEVPANIILGNGDITANNATFNGNVAVSNTNPAWGVITDNLYYSNGSSWDLQQAAGSNTQIQFNNNDNFGANVNFTYDYVTSTLTLVGTANITSLQTTDIFSGASQNLYINANGYISTFYGNGLTSFAGNIATTSNLSVGNAALGNLATANYINVASNVISNNITTNLLFTGNTANFSGNVILPNLTVNLELQANTANFDGNVVMDSWLYVADTANVVNLRTDNLLYANGQPWDLQEAAGSNTEIQFNTNDNFDASANFTYDKTFNSGGGQLNVGNSVGGRITTDDLYVSYANVNGNIELTGNITTAANANVGNLNVTSNVVLTGGDITGVDNISANSANFTGNISAANIIGDLANGSSNVKVYEDANVEISINGTSNVVSITSGALYVAGEINSTSGNILANGNVTANGFVNGANANITGEALLNSVKTANITAPTGNITINAASTDFSINLVPTGNGTVDVALKRITQVANPVAPNDAATREYVDSVSQGLHIHTPVLVTSTTNLTATYANGGTTLTTTTISGGKTITFGANHGLSVGDEIYWDNTFNGITAYNGYYVFSTPSLDTITIKDGYYGTEVTTLTNGTGLSETAQANSGVGATLTNAGANSAISIDGISLTTTDRVLVQGQTNAFENGVYTVTTVGNGSTAWVLTRATDSDTYGPDDNTTAAAGDYYFVQEGSSYAGSSYVLTSPVGEIVFGYTDIVYTQFSAAGSYSAGSGITITGTTISANTDNVTTTIVGGNIVVKASAQFTTPNIDAATGTSLSVTGNVTANGLSIAGLANIDGNITGNSYLFVNNAIASNANVSGTNLNASGNVAATGNVVGANVTANATVFAANANVSGTTITDYLTVNNLISGSTANFSGNLSISNSNPAWGVLTDNLYYSNGAPWDLQEAAGSNTQIQFNNNDNFGASANLTFDTATDTLGVIGDANISNAVVVGNTTVSWSTVTTTSITANQTIASVPVSGITGVEFLVKGVDSAGSGKYSVATVQAVTNGSSVDYSTYGSVYLGSTTGTLAVNIVGGFLRLQASPSSSNSTVWTTQFRLI